MLTDSQIELLEDLPLSGHYKWYTLLAVTGHKKASWADLHSDPWREGDTPNRISKERLALLESKLDALGLFHELTVKDAEHVISQPDESTKKRKRYIEFANIFIANSQAALDELVREWAAEKQDDRRVGLALDYPATAVEAFASGNGVHTDQPSNGDVNKEVLKRAYFMLSAENYKDELKVVEGWLDAVKQNSQTIYSELDKHYL